MIKTYNHVGGGSNVKKKHTHPHIGEIVGFSYSKNSIPILTVIDPPCITPTKKHSFCIRSPYTKIIGNRDAESTATFSWTVEPSAAYHCRACTQLPTRVTGHLR